MYERILENRLKAVTETQVDEALSGFRKEMSSQDYIYPIKQILKKNILNATYAYLGLLHLKKAFKKIQPNTAKSNKNQLWK